MGGSITPTVLIPGGRTEPYRASGAQKANTGLTNEQVDERVQRGDINAVDRQNSRTISGILISNIFTRFNAILGALLCIILYIGPLQDALFGGVLVVNTLIGIVQEVRAKRALDRLAVISAPTARVVRSGHTIDVPVASVVLDDVLEFRPGDQVVADGIVLTSEDLEIDEALISGESEPLLKVPGDHALSGSFVTAGHGYYRATAVGSKAYAQKLSSAAKVFKPAHSEMSAGINRILRYVLWTIAVAAPVLLWSQFRAQPLFHAAALRSTVAGVVAMVPQGLVLLTSLAMAVAVTRLGRRRTLIQELPAVETLARVTTLCLDKTGTLTTGKLNIADLEILDADAEIAKAFGALAAADPAPNATLRAIAAKYLAPTDWKATEKVAFSSARKWSKVCFGDHGNWVLGAPDVLLVGDMHVDLLKRAAAHAKTGRRVLLLAHARTCSNDQLPADLVPAAFVLLAEDVRSNAAETLAYFVREGVAIKIISGDHPETVAAVARQVGVPGADDPVDALHLPSGDAALATLMDARSIFGRATPDGKRAMIAALQSKGHVVAMTGDGVNDVLALKQADIGIAMGAGSGAARAIAQLTLLDGNFACLPDVLAEGRRVIANIERLAILFVTKTVFAAVLVVTVAASGLVYPFLPRQLSLVGALTIGIPAFFLSLAPNARRARPGFLPRVLHFAIPAGIAAAIATLAAYSIALYPANGSLEEASTVASLVLFSCGLANLAYLCRPFTPLRVLLLAALTAAFASVLIVPISRSFFALVALSSNLWFTATISGALAVMAVLLLLSSVTRKRASMSR
ncbi:P-type E1-E2 ATPase [Sphingomonas sp. UYP23]